MGIDIKGKLERMLFEGEDDKPTPTSKPNIIPTPTASVPIQPVQQSPNLKSPINQNTDSLYNLSGEPQKPKNEAILGQVDQTLATKIKAAIDQTDPLFGQFIGVIESYIDIIPDETTRIKTAVASMQRLNGIAPAQIRTAFENRIKLIQGEFEKINTAYNQRMMEVNSQQNKIESINSEISALQLKIQQLIADRDAIIQTTAEQKTKLDTYLQNAKVTASAMIDEVSNQQTIIVNI